jgi:hypothetical protein
MSAFIFLFYSNHISCKSFDQKAKQGTQRDTSSFNSNYENEYWVEVGADPKNRHLRNPKADDCPSEFRIRLFGNRSDETCESISVAVI